MQRYVVDSSVVARYFYIGNERESGEIEKARLLLKKSYESKLELFAPSLLLFETNNCFVKYAPRKIIDRNIDFLKGLIDRNIIQIIPTSAQLLKDAARIAATDTKGKGHISSYDSIFHALAIETKATYITTDKKHYRKTKEMGSIILLEDWE